LALAVRGRREAAGLSLSALATAAGLSKSTLWGIETGTSNPGLDAIGKVAAALGSEVGGLLAGRPEMADHPAADQLVVARPADDTGGRPVPSRRGGPGQAPATRSGLRAQALEVAFALFASQGPGGVDLPVVAAKLGVPPATVYYHFQSRRNLVYLAIRAWLEQQTTQLLAADAARGDAKDRLRGFVRALVESGLEWSRRHGPMRFAPAQALPSLESQQAAALARLLAAQDNHLKEILRAGLRAGAFDCVNVHETAAMILSLARDVPRWYRDDLSLQDRHVAVLAADLALRMCRRGGQAPLLKRS
jgi:AcrR family transcriptional regulator